MSRLLYRLSYAALRRLLYLKTAPGATGKSSGLPDKRALKLFIELAGLHMHHFLQFESMGRLGMWYWEKCDILTVAND
jgi:hypothetical protein